MRTMNGFGTAIGIIDRLVWHARSVISQQMNNIKLKIANPPSQQLLLAGVVVFLVGTFGIAVVMAWTPAVTDSPGIAPENIAAQVGRDVRDRKRCPECGMVESRREIVQVDKEINSEVTEGLTKSARNKKMPKSYEITLRMKDGSSHRFIDANPVNWRLGERVILISSKSTSND